MKFCNAAFWPLSDLPARPLLHRCRGLNEHSGTASRHRDRLGAAHRTADDGRASSLLRAVVAADVLFGGLRRFVPNAVHH